MVHSDDVDTLGPDTSKPTGIPELHPRRKVRADVGALSHEGKIRKNNEDHYLVVRLRRVLEPVLSNVSASLFPGQVEEEGYGMLVADGMGGAAAGEIASQLAIRFLGNLVVAAGKWGRRIDRGEAREIARRAGEYYAQIHAALLKEAEADPALAGMGTTLTIAYNFCDELVIAHIGDSRAYLYRRGELHQLTRDHTLAQLMVDRGQLSRREAARHHFRHLLTKVLGGKPGSVAADIEHIRLEDQDRLLLCSDGLTDMLDDTTISQVLASAEDAGTACSRLVELALDAGGKDNITTVLAHYTITQ
jgi:PPM family protein phosphatase